MTPERWEAVKRLFNDALERAPDERAAYVAEAAKRDPALAEEVRALLSGQGRADEAFGALTRTGGLNKTLTEGTRLGPYEIVALVGAGGMGEVYKARDTRRSLAVDRSDLRPCGIPLGRKPWDGLLLVVALREVDAAVVDACDMRAGRSGRTHDLFRSATSDADIGACSAQQSPRSAHRES